MTPAPETTRPIEDTRPILQSASKIVFLMIAVTICVSFMMGKFTQENFAYIAVSVFSYYFGQAQKPAGIVIPPAPQEPPKV